MRRSNKGKIPQPADEHIANTKLETNWTRRQNHWRRIWIALEVVVLVGAVVCSAVSLSVANLYSAIFALVVAQVATEVSAKIRIWIMGFTPSSVILPPQGDNR